MATATMTSKGQITVPKDVREDLGLTAGSKLMFVKLAAGDYRVVARTGRIHDLAGILHDSNRPALTVDEIGDAIAEAGAASGLRGLKR